jgi:sporulation protein YqfC
MKHTSNLRNYIYQKEFKITIKKNMINIENFTNIGKIENYEIVIYNNKEKITIKGKNLSINKMLSSEVLILGNYNEIIFEGENE